MAETLKYKELQKATEKFGKDNVLLIERCPIFPIIKIIIPSFFFVFFLAIFLSLWYYYFEESTFMIWFLWTTATLLTAFFIKYIIDKTLDYKRDFTLITINGILTYKQYGIFNAKMKNIPINYIKYMTSNYSGFFGKIFGYWYIEFITDNIFEETWDKSEMLGSKTKLTYVQYPEDLKEKIISMFFAQKKIEKFNIKDYLE